MRQSINEGVSIAKGKYICKCDDHVAFSKGYDEILATDCEDNWLAVPARYSLNGEAWLNGADNIKKYGPIHHLTITYPFNHDPQFGYGMHGKKWFGEHGVTGGYFDREKQRKAILIDDVLSIQGSCWFMPRKLFHDLDCMQIDGYFDYQEAQELVFKTWLSGGRCVVNKKVWYAHLHKNDQWGGKGYHALRHQKTKSEIYSTDFWLNNRWEKQTRPFKWLIEHPSWFPLESWPDGWDNPKAFKNYDYSTWYGRG
jgi:glycosyltransferase involved in cell wall biosynthesis